MVSFKLRALRRTGLFLLGASLVVFGAACGGDDDDDDAGGAETPGTTATTAADATTAPEGTYPLTVTDLLGREVEIEAKPEVVVAISPTAVEFVYAAGAKVAGRSASVDFPPEAASAQDVGTAYQPNFEQILALKPDLVVADSVIHSVPQLRQPLEELPVPVIFAGADSYEKVLEGLDLMGEVFDSKETTDKVIASIEEAKENAKKALEGKNVTAVALIADRDNTLYAAKANSFAGDVLEELGITNPAASQPDAGPFPGYTTLAAEKLIEFNPDYIFAITPAPPPAPRLASLIPNIPPFRGLKAVTGGNVVDAEVQIFLQAPGPRIAEAFNVVAESVTGQ